MTRNHARRSHYDRVKDARPNYHILTSNIVAKVLFQGKNAIGVSYLPTNAGSTASPVNVYAAKEVVLAAGGFGTPKILQLSGIGRKTLLQKFGLPLVADLPGVGQNLQDQPTLEIPYTCESTQFPWNLYITNVPSPTSHCQC
jgi:choline dehydrogenase-like flavoprotein